MRRLTLIVTLALIFSLLWATPALAEIISVPSDYPTIQEAVDVAADGDTILVGPGEYAGAIVTKAVEIRGSAAGTVINDGPFPWPGYGFKAGFLFPDDYSGSGATVSLFTFKCGTVTGYGSQVMVFPVFSRGADNVTVAHNTIYGPIQGITNWHGSGWIIEHNKIEGLQAFNGGGIGIFVGACLGGTCANNLVAFNAVTGDLSEVNYSTPGICLMSDRRWGRPGGTITNNVVRQNRCAVAGESGVGIELTDMGLSRLSPPVADLTDNIVAFNDVRGSTFGLALNPAEVAGYNIISRNLGDVANRRWDGINPSTVLQ